MPRRKVDGSADLKRKSPDTDDAGRPKRAMKEKGVPGWEEYDDGALLVFNKDMEGRAKVRYN